MKTALVFFNAVALCAICSGCLFKTASLSNLKAIPIPDGLTNREAVCGVVLATDPSRMPPQWTNMEKIKARFVTAFSLHAGSMHDAYSDCKWRVEEVRDDYAVLGLTTLASKHYARVKYAVSGSSLVPSVLDADLLKLNAAKTRMHKNGVMWINRNVAVIREGMWQVKAIKEDAAEPDAALRVRKAELSKP